MCAIKVYNRHARLCLNHNNINLVGDKGIVISYKGNFLFGSHIIYIFNSMLIFINVLLCRILKFLLFIILPFRRFPNFIESITNFVLCIVILTFTMETNFYSTNPHRKNYTDQSESFIMHSYGEEVTNQSDSESTPIVEGSPLFILDLLYGWPIDPRDEYQINDSYINATDDYNVSEDGGTSIRGVKAILKESYFDTNSWWGYTIAIFGICVLSASLQTVIRSTEINVTKVVFFQGLGPLVYTLIGTFMVTCLSI